MASKVRLSELTESDGTETAELVELGLVVLLLLDELLQAAAARHKASDADTTSPFLASWII